jgi:hypothetical protein
MQNGILFVRVYNPGVPMGVGTEFNEQLFGVQQEQLRQLNEFRAETKSKLEQIDGHLTALADVRAVVTYIRESQNAILTKLGSFDEKVSDLYSRTQKAHGRIDVIDKTVDNHNFWLRTMGVSVALGILAVAGSALVWAISNMGAHP